jgi:hypothetical protein
LRTCLIGTLNSAPGGQGCHFFSGNKRKATIFAEAQYMLSLEPKNDLSSQGKEREERERERERCGQRQAGP